MTTDYQKGAEAMREACARCICADCRDGIPVKRLHGINDPKDITFAHGVGSLSDGRGYGKECGAKAIRAIDVEALKPSG